MPKRKRSESEGGDCCPDLPSKRHGSSKQRSLEGVLDNGKKTLYRALRVSRGFERQKLGRRQGAAKEKHDTAATNRLASEVTALKKLDLAGLGEIYLYKSVLKSKPISTAPAFPSWIAENVKKSSPNSDAATANVTARLLNSNPTKAALDTVLRNVHNVLDLAMDDVPRRKKRLRAADYKAQTQVKESGNKEPDQEHKHAVPRRSPERKPLNSQAPDAVSCGQVATSIKKEIEPQAPDAFGGGQGATSIKEGIEDEVEDYDVYSSRLANSSEDESEDLEAIVSAGEDEEQAQGVPVNKATSHWAVPHSLPSLSPSLSRSVSGSLSPSPPPRNFKNSAPPKPTTSTTFLPTLNGGYWSGSEGPDGIGDELEDPLAIKPRKNRRGQQERRAIWEKKYGVNANHVKTRELGDSKRGRDEGWDPKRGACDDDKDWAGRDNSKRRKYSEGGTNGSRGMVRSGANSDPINGARQRGGDVKSGVKGKAAEGPLHPSWEAKKRAKEKAGNTMVAFQGKKVVFD